MQHPRQREVVHEPAPAAHLVREVQARCGPAELRAGRPGRGLHGGRGLDVQRDRGGELGVAGCSRGADEAPVVDAQRVGGRAQELGRDGQEPRAHLGGHVAQGLAALLHRPAAGRALLVGAAGGRGGRDHADAVQPHAEPVRGDLRERRGDPLAELDLAGPHGDRPVALHAHPRVQRAGWSRATRAGRSRRPTRPRAGPRRSSAGGCRSGRGCGPAPRAPRPRWGWGSSASSAVALMRMPGRQ